MDVLLNILPVLLGVVVILNMVAILSLLGREPKKPEVTDELDLRIREIKNLQRARLRQK